MAALQLRREQRIVLVFSPTGHGSPAVINNRWRTLARRSDTGQAFGSKPQAFMKIQNYAEGATPGGTAVAERWTATVRRFG